MNLDPNQAARAHDAAQSAERGRVRKAALASTVGTTRSSGTTTPSTAQRRRWCSLRCSSRKPSHYVGTFESFATYFVGFAARPIRRDDLRALGMTGSAAR